MAENRRCPKCTENGHDKDGDHLFLMSNGDRWCCNKIQYHSDSKPYFEDLNGESTGEAYSGASELASLLNAGDGADDSVAREASDDEPDDGRPKLSLPGITSTASSTAPSSFGKREPVRSEYRGIQPSTYKKFKTDGIYSAGGKLLTLEHDLYEVGTGDVLTSKYRDLPKVIKCRGKTKGKKIQLFGQSIFPAAKRLLITEGELDAMSAWQMLKKWNVACVSLPLGANVKSLIDNEKYLAPYLKGSKELIFCIDADDAGGKVSRDIAVMYPEAKFVAMDKKLKDANSYLMEGEERAFVSAFWDAEKWKPPTIIRVADVITDVMKKPVIGRPWPWPSLTEATYGRRDGEGIYVGAGK